ncbi:MAG TPA: hypothetical protein VGG35_25955 [Streptosporangiaceae bacterium]|jgi:hypothetical protein
MTAGSGEVVLALEPTTVAEWDVRDMVCGDRSASLALATREEAEQLLGDVALGVPRLSPVRRLLPGQGPAAADTAPPPDSAGTAPPAAGSQRAAAGPAAGSGDAGPVVPLSPPPAAHAGQFDFHLMELPVSISVPAGRTLTRLRLGLRAEPAQHQAAPVVAYDLFPELEDASQRLANPVAWNVSGAALAESFTAYVIWRAPRNMALRVSATMLGELLGSGDPPGDSGALAGRLTPRMRKAQFRSASQLYEIPSWGAPPS